MKSDIVKNGPERAPHRSLLKALGLSEDEIRRPWVGVVNAKNELIPGHIHLDRIAGAVKEGVWMSGGTPLEFPAIGVCDGLAMGHDGMQLLPAEPGAHRRLHRDHGPGPRARCPGPGDQLRQDHPGHAHGGGAAQHPVDPRQRRPDARRKMRRPGGQSDRRLRSRRPRSGTAAWARTSSSNTRRAPAPAAAPARACSPRTP